MAARRRPTEGSDAKGEADAEAAMERFRELTRRLLKVPRDELAEQQRKHDDLRKKKAAGPKPRAARVDGQFGSQTPTRAASVC